MVGIGNGRGHRVLRGMVAMVLLASLGVVVPATAANAVARVSTTTESTSGFPAWYEDATGIRLVPCLDGNDPRCVLPAAGEQSNYDPAQPIAFPGNFPLEFFYANAQAELSTGCPSAGIPAGRARLVLAVEGAFANGRVRANDRMTFGRIRVVADGLCPGTDYTFTHPYGTVTATTDTQGAIATSTSDTGCVPAGGRNRCDWARATGSPVFGGFLRWDAGAPAGYLGDGTTPHAVTGGTDGNRFAISTGGTEVLGTDLFVVSGKLAALGGAPDRVSFTGVPVDTESAPQTITVTNFDTTQAGVTLGAINVTGTDSGQFSVGPTSTCATGANLSTDATCTVDVVFAPIGEPGPRTANLEIASTAVRPLLVVPLSGQALAAPDAAALQVAPLSLDFGEVRRLTTSAAQQVTVTNTGTGASTLQVEGALADDPQFTATLGTCNNVFLLPTQSCAIDVEFAPVAGGAGSGQLTITTNAGSALVTLTGTGVGGTALVAVELDADNGFPVWYRDDNGLTVGQCLDPADPYCLLLPDNFYSASAPVDYPGNFPSEFFYQVAEAVAPVNDPQCENGTADAMLISAVEAAFANEAPADVDRMTFGRIRFRVGEGGLCPNTEYEFVSPFGADRFTTDEFGGLKPSPGTEDIGCLPEPTVPCDFAAALPSRVFADFVRWDPAVEPQAPAGHLGDPAVEHSIVGGSYTRNGSPVDYFEVRRVSDDVRLGGTDQFSVMGRLAGPLESDPTAVDFGRIPEGETSAPTTVTLTNAGESPLDIETLTLAGPHAGDFAVDPGTTTCDPTTLDPAETCTVAVTFTPSGTGTRTGHLTVSHTGQNDPLVIPLAGIGGTAGPDIGFLPAAIDFGALHVGRASQLEQVTVTNVGGGQDVLVTAAATGSPEFVVTENACTTVAPDSTCTITVQFTPAGTGVRTATLTVDSTDPDGPTTVALTGFGSTADPAAGAIDTSIGFPAWYGDSNGVRLEPCLRSGGNCLLPAEFDPAQAPAVPGNFPDEFFYAHAATDPVPVDEECTAGTPNTGQLSVEHALEGAFANGVVESGEQIVFTRTRILGDGLCPGGQYTVLTPYGPVDLVATNGIIRHTVDIPVELVDPITGAGGQADSFLRWNPNVSPAAPAGHIGDARTPHRVIGGTYVPEGDSAPLNAVIVLRGATEVGGTDQFIVSGRIGGPLLASPTTVDFGNVVTNSAVDPVEVTITNIGAATAGVAAVTITGTHAALFSPPGTGCDGASLITDGSCTIAVDLSPGAITGTKTATMVVTGADGSSVRVALRAVVNAPTAPIATIAPTALGFGEVRFGSIVTKSVVVTNDGNTGLNLDPMVASLPAEFKVVDGCTATVPAGDSCAIDVTFEPDATESLSGTLTIDHGNAAGGPTTVTVTGSGVASVFTVSPDPGRFGRVRVGQSKTTSITVRNTGTISVDLTKAEIGGTDAASFSLVQDAETTNCLTVDLGAGASCRLTVLFAPLERRTYAATLAVTGDESSIPGTRIIQLTGTGR